MNPQQLMNVIRDKNRELTAKNQEYEQLMIDYAEAEYAFNVAYRTKILELSIEGKPVTTQKDLALGDKAIAKLKLQVNVADALVKSNKQSMKVIEKGIDSARSGLSWLKAEMLNTK